MYYNWRTIKFYTRLYFTRVTGRERSGTTSYSIDTGVIHAVNKLSQFVEVKEEIEPKSFTIDISFEDLGLELSSVSSSLLSVCLSGCLSVCLFGCLYVCLSVYLCVCFSSCRAFSLAVRMYLWIPILVYIVMIMLAVISICN